MFQAHRVPLPALCGVASQRVFPHCPDRSVSHRASIWKSYLPQPDSSFRSCPCILSVFRGRALMSDLYPLPRSRCSMSTRCSLVVVRCVMHEASLWVSPPVFNCPRLWSDLLFCCHGSLVLLARSFHTGFRNLGKSFQFRSTVGPTSFDNSAACGMS